LPLLICCPPRFVLGVNAPTCHPPTRKNIQRVRVCEGVCACRSNTGTIPIPPCTYTRSLLLCTRPLLTLLRTLEPSRLSLDPTIYIMVFVLLTCATSLRSLALPPFCPGDGSVASVVQGMSFSDFFRGTQARLVHMMYAPSCSLLCVDMHDASPFHPSPSVLHMMMYFDARAFSFLPPLVVHTLTCTVWCISEPLNSCNREPLSPENRAIVTVQLVLYDNIKVLVGLQPTGAAH
jgi:hypothetical protein